MSLNDWTSGTKRKSNSLKEHVCILWGPMGPEIPDPGWVSVAICDVSHSILRLDFSKCIWIAMAEYVKIVD